MRDCVAPVRSPNNRSAQHSKPWAARAHAAEAPASPAPTTIARRSLGGGSGRAGSLRGMNRGGGHAAGPVDSGGGSGDELARLREEAGRLQAELGHTRGEDEPAGAPQHRPGAGGPA